MTNYTGYETRSVIIDRTKYLSENKNCINLIFPCPFYSNFFTVPQCTFFYLQLKIPAIKTNFITMTYCSIEYTSRWTGFKFTPLVVMGTYCTGSCKSNYHSIIKIVLIWYFHVHFIQIFLQCHNVLFFIYN
jgi:hypothetical protein